MAIVWIADIAAYFAGRAFGRRKLAPSISPGKTWEGVYGALAAVAVYALALVPLAARGGYRGALSAGRDRAVGRARAAARRAVGRRRPVRVAAEAPGRRQGQRHAAARPRRRARPHRRADSPRCRWRRWSRYAFLLMNGDMQRNVAILGATGSIGASHARRRRAPSGSLRASLALAAHRQWRDAARAVPALPAARTRRCSIPTRRATLERALAARRPADARCSPARGPVRGRRAARGRHRDRGDRRRRRPARRRSPRRARASASCSPTRKRWSSAGALFMDAVRDGGATLLPIDSEHNAIFQCLPRGYARRAGRGRRAAHPAHRLRRAVPHARRWRSSRASRRTRPARIRTGAWGARSRSIRRR